MSTEDENARASMAQAIKKFFAMTPEQIEWFAVEAKVCYMRFQALKKQGFTAAEAIQLCTRKVEL